ncbi:MAG: ABC transporter ATP-binding protein [Pseudomonadota bacterium]
MLEVDNLHSGYERIPILNGITLTLGSGEVVGVLGHNGMGKTTLLRTLIGQLRATEGSIKLEGQDVTSVGMAERVRRGLGYVPQGRDIFPRLSVMENLRMGEVVLNGKSGIPEILDHFPILRGMLDRPGGALSGGEQQILALARCLVGKPKVILLDEPTEGVQPSMVEYISEKLETLVNQFRPTLLLVEQNLAFISGLAERVLIIQKGQIVSTIRADQLEDPEVIDKYLGI